MDELAGWLDDRGVTLVNFVDPEDGSKVPAVDWQQLVTLRSSLEAELRAEYSRGQRDEMLFASGDLDD